MYMQLVFYISSYYSTLKSSFYRLIYIILYPTIVFFYHLH